MWVFDNAYINSDNRVDKELRIRSTDSNQAICIYPNKNTLHPMYDILLTTIVSLQIIKKKSRINVPATAEPLNA